MRLAEFREPQRPRLLVHWALGTDTAGSLTGQVARSSVHLTIEKEVCPRGYAVGASKR